MVKLNPYIYKNTEFSVELLKNGETSKIPGTQFGNYTPLFWCHYFDGGRQFYTALGHKKEYYQDEKFLQHLLGGIQWVLREE